MEDGSMIVSGFYRPMDNLSYIVGTVSDHILEINGSSIKLRALWSQHYRTFLTGRRIFIN